MRSMIRRAGQLARRLVSTCLVLCTMAYSARCRPTEDVDPFIEDCRTWCHFNMVCDGGPDNTFACVDSCEDSFELDAVDYGPDCETTFKEAMACIADMTCEEYHLFQNVPLHEGPCPDILARYYDLCPGVFLAPERPEP